MTQLKITDDLDALLDVLPLDIRHAVEKANDSENLLEIILDLGRVPTARFVDHEINLRESEVTRAEIDYVDERTGEFDADTDLADNGTFGFRQVPLQPGAENLLTFDSKFQVVPQLAERWETEVWEGRSEAVEGHLRELVAQGRDDQEATLRRCADYLRTHQHRLRYPHFRAQGWPVGSGVVEGGCIVAVTS